MSKICPNCKEIYYDDEEFICGSCGVNLVEMTEKPNPTLHLGDANAISGGVSINQSKNITSHDVHYHSTTVHERAKSEAELKLDANNQLRAKAEEIMAEKGRIDSAAVGQLRPFALQLGIDDETFKTIIKDVRSNRNGSSSGLNAANARYLQQAQQAVKTSDMDTLSNLTPRLEAMAAISQDDNVQYLYYLTLSLFYPLKSMEVYERQTDENYWRAFWAIISYIRTGKYAEASSLLALFDPLRYEKSEEDQNLLEAYFNIMKEDKDGAQEFLDELLGEPSEQVKPLLHAVESSLYEEEADSLEVRFYMERVMTKANAVVKPQRNVEPSISVEELSTKATTLENKNNKEADELYAKASAASDVKRVMLLQKAADAGSLEAMFDLGDCYYDGEGVEKNMPLAIKWITKAADLGYLSAQAALGACYLVGEEGVEQNYVMAEKYLLMAAERGQLKAQEMLAGLYIEIEEYDKALKWARIAAQLESPYACFVLGRIHAEGLGVEMNHIEGLKWYEKAANLGDADAQNTCGGIYSFADFVEHDLEKSFKYYQMAAAQGHLWGMYNLACCYSNGNGTNLNMMLAEEWMQKAASGGLQEAKDIIENVIPRTDNIVPNQDDEEAELKRALDAYYNSDYETASNIWGKWAERGNSVAMAYLADCYRDGEGVAQDFKEAALWYRKAADLGNNYAMAYLGDCYLNGIGVSRNHNEAVKWYKKAGELGNVYAYMCLADSSESPAKAVEWWLKAAELGSAEACRNLGVYYKSKDIKKAVEWCEKALVNGYDDENEIKRILEDLKKNSPNTVEQDVEIVKVWADNNEFGRKQITLHFDAKLHKNTNNICVIAVPTMYQDDFSFLYDRDWDNIGYRGQSFDSLSSKVELRNYMFSFTASELNDALNDGNIESDGVYSIKMALAGICGGRPAKNKLKKAFSGPLFIINLKFKITTHLFLANDIEVI